MSKTIHVDIPMNRVEGDLEVRVEIEDGVVTDAWCSGTMYRGFERILQGRGPLDGLVITPRICGICTTSHLTAAAKALDDIGQVQAPPNAVRIRNLALMTEHIQSDVRQTFLMAAVDWIKPRYKDAPLYEEACRRFAPFEGETVVDVIRNTKKVLEIIAIVGGQWPHSSFIVPGGVASIPAAPDLMQCRMLLTQYRHWYEERILGCNIDRIAAIRSVADLDSWLEEADAHRDSPTGLFVRHARDIGLDQQGRGHDQFVSYGYLDLPEGTELTGPCERGGCLIPPGFAVGTEVAGFDQARITEHIAHSWFEGYEGGVHPSEGMTRPYATGDEGQKYSWAKAPRYHGKPAQTGPLAEAIVSGNKLALDLVDTGGASSFARQITRLLRPVTLIPAMQQWLDETIQHGKVYESPGKIVEGTGIGLTHAGRGALGHWVRIANRKIEHYQIITPTAWNASPRDSDDVRGPMEEALVGTAVQDPEHPVELGALVRSFDPCLVCTVHAVHRGKSLGRVRVGLTP